MLKKDIFNSLKLIQYYKFINYNLIYNNKAINRYNKDNYEVSKSKAENLENLKRSILNQKNCELKKNAKNIVFSDGNPKSDIMLIGEAPGANEDEEGFIKQCFFEFKENGIFQFLTGPFINKGFKIVGRQNNAIKILIGKFKITVSKENYLFRPVY